MKELSMSFKALADENRLIIMKMLMSGEICACEILDKLNITQPTLSHHMKVLLSADLVIARRAGKWVHYSPKNENLVFKSIKNLL